MALTRTTAEVNNILVLRATFRKPLIGTLFHPNSLVQVRIIDTDTNTVLQTIVTANITKVSTGIYEVSSQAANYDVGGTYYDEWTWQEADGDANTVTTLSTVVKDTTPAFNARADAVTDRNVILYQEFRQAADNVLFDPFSVDKVEILDTDGTTVLETNNDPTKQSVGIYYIIASGANLDVAGTYKDKWSYTLTDGAATSTATNDLIVKELKSVGTGDYKVQVNVTDSSTTLGLPDLEVLVSDNKNLKLLSTTTDTMGRAFFYMNAGTYTFSVRDPINTDYVFSENHKSLTVQAAWDTVPGTANPNLLAFNVKYFPPDWASAAALASTDLCLITGKFADLEGNSLRGIKVRITNKYVPNIKSTYAILGDNLALTSDISGQISAYLVRNSEVSVTFEGTGITRHVTIPDAATQDIVALVGAGQDIFTIAVDNTATVPARVP